MMPVARFQLPDGRIARFEVPEGTTPEQAQAMMQQQLGQMGEMQPQQAQAAPPAAPVEAPQAPAVAPEPSFLQAMTGQVPIAPEAGVAMGAGEVGRRILEPALTVGTGIVAEPVAGLAGLVTAPVAGAERAEDVIEATREALTFQPRTEAGTAQLQQVGEFVQPAAEALQAVETGLGDAVMSATGSPALAAGATALPAGIIEALGFGVGRKAATAGRTIPKKIPTPKQVSQRKVTNALIEAAPEIDQIKDTSRAIYKEIDDMNVTLKPLARRAVLTKAINRAQASNVDEVLTPNSARVAELFARQLDDPQPMTLTQLDQLRQRAQIAAQSQIPADARIGAQMVDEIDAFIDNLPQKAFTGPDAATIGNVGERFKAARGLWGRARRAEVVSEIFDKAKRQATGFENGLRTQLRQLLNNKKRSRYFSKDELAAMDEIVKGTGKANTLKLIGRLGFSEGAATNVLGGLVGMGVLGPAAPAVGQISRKFAQKVTEGAARRMEALVRSGKDSNKIAQIYLQSVPKGKRSAMELSDLLLSSGAEVEQLLNHSRQVVKEAAEIARARRAIQAAEAAGAAAPAAAMTAIQQREDQP